MPPSTLKFREAAALQLNFAERLLFSLEDDEIMLTWYAEAAQRGAAFERGEETAAAANDVVERLQAMISSARPQ